MGLEICFLGLGMMGYPMAQRIHRAGNSLHVVDADPERTAAFHIEHQMSRVEDKVNFSRIDIVITMLPDSEVVEAALFGKQNIATQLKKGSVVIDMSSSDPTRSQVVAKRLGELGLEYLDAPVSGGVKKAKAGGLAIMVGGKKATFDLYEDLLITMGKNVFYVGPAGSGHAIKVLNNYLSGITLLSVAEVLHVGQRFGLDPATMVDVFNASTGKSNSTENKVKQFILNNQFNSGFAMRLLVKDLALANALGKSMGSPTNLGDECYKIFANAVRELQHNPDHTEIYRYLDHLVSQQDSI